MTDTNVDIDGNILMIYSIEDNLFIYFKEQEQLRQKLLWTVKREVKLVFF